jgi:hypothetical protein
MNRLMASRLIPAVLVLGPLLSACRAESSSRVSSLDSEAAAEVEMPSARVLCPIRRGDGCRTVHAADTKTLFPGTSVLMPGATFMSSDGRFHAFAPLYDRAVGLHVASTDLLHFSAPEVVLGNIGDITGADTPAGRFLYFVGGTQGATALYRSRVDPTGTVDPPSAVTGAGIPIVPFWPQATTLHDGRVLLAFVQPQTRAFLALSQDGLAPFTPLPTPVPSGVHRGILAHVGQTTAGAWVFTHQSADDRWLFTSYAHLSRDGGATWSAPIVVSPDVSDVHDAYPLSRSDEGVDLYYLHVGEGGVFGAFRRALFDDGRLGPEQAVTAADVGHVEKPQARRLPDGRIALSFAVRKAEGVYDIRLAILDDDAPPP